MCCVSVYSGYRVLSLVVSTSFCIISSSLIKSSFHSLNSMARSSHIPFAPLLTKSLSSSSFLWHASFSVSACLACTSSGYCISLSLCVLQSLSATVCVVSCIMCGIQVSYCDVLSNIPQGTCISHAGWLDVHYFILNLYCVVFLSCICTSCCKIVSLCCMQWCTLFETWYKFVGALYLEILLVDSVFWKDAPYL